MEIRRHTTVQRSRGFTLLELLMVLALGAVIVGLAAPSFVDAIQRNRQQSIVGRIGASLAFARGEAVVRRGTVSLCPSTNAAECGGTSWDTGWLVFEDDGAGSDGVADDGVLNGDEELLSIADGAGSGITVRARGFISSANIVFTETGRLMSDNAGTLVFCDARGAAEARGLIINVSGQRRLAVVGTDEGDTLREDHAGNVLSCP